MKKENEYEVTFQGVSSPISVTVGDVTLLSHWASFSQDRWWHVAVVVQPHGLEEMR